MTTATEDKSATASAPEVESDRPTVRLSVNLAPDVADALKNLSKGMSITEGVRRAIAIWNFLESERAKGHTLAAIEPSVNGAPERIREIVLI